MTISDLFSCRLKSSRQLPVAMLKRGWKAPSNTYRALSETATHANRFTTYQPERVHFTVLLSHQSESITLSITLLSLSVLNSPWHSFTLMSVSVYYTQHYSPIIISLKQSITHSLTLGLTSVSVHYAQYYSPIIIGLKQSITCSSLTHTSFKSSSKSQLFKLSFSSYLSLSFLWFFLCVCVCVW